MHLIQPVQCSGLYRSSLSNHLLTLTKRFMMVLLEQLDWLDHKVAIMNLLQVADHMDTTPQFLHSSVVDFVHEKSFVHGKTG